MAGLLSGFAPALQLVFWLSSSSWNVGHLDASSRTAEKTLSCDQSSAETTCDKLAIIIIIIIWQGKSERSDWFLLGRDFAIRTVSVETVISCVFLFSKAGKLKTSMVRVPYNKLLTNRTSSSRTGEYWPSVVFVRTSPRPRANIPQYGPRARLVRG